MDWVGLGSVESLDPTQLSVYLDEYLLEIILI